MELQTQEANQQITITKTFLPTFLNNDPSIPPPFRANEFEKWILTFQRLFQVMYNLRKGKEKR
ncbi:hypothetical protein CW304_31645 [Bacillus sp. UFRGS-B20]|nr:hypothetical protein CW304_31645 [Bacillus sp. UFRGS-B20]